MSFSILVNNTVQSTNVTQQTVTVQYANTVTKVVTTSSVATIAAMRLISGTTDGQFLQLDGYYTEGDGGGGSFFWNATSTTSDNGGTIIAPTGVATGRWYRIYSDVVDIKFFGCKGDGVTDDTAAFSNCVNSGIADITVPGDSFLISQVNIPSTVRSITGTGTIIQKTAGITPFYSTTASNILIQGLRFVGVGGTVTGTNEDNAIHFVGTSTLTRIWIDKCDFTAFIHTSAWIQNAAEVFFTNNVTHSSFQGIRFSGVFAGVIDGNIFTDTSAATTEFQPVITLDSTLEGYSVCQYISISNNQVSGYANCQAVLIHAGIEVTVSNNKLIGINQGVGAGAFNATDTINSIVITGNIITSNATAGAGTGNQSINVAGYDGTHLGHSIVITGNICIGANTVDQSAAEGAIQISYLDDIVISDNILDGWYNAGVYVNDISTRFKIVTNNIMDGENVSAINAGIWIASGAGACTGLVDSNYFDAVYYAFKCESTTATGVVWGPNNYYTNISGSTLTGAGSYTAPATTSPVIASGSAYQNTTAGFQDLYVPVTFNPTAGAAATCLVSLGPTTGPIAGLYTASIPATAVVGQVNPIHIRIPPGWYYALTTTNATIGTANLVSEL